MIRQPSPGGRFVGGSIPLGAGSVVLLALGHTISNLVRTMPAISADVIAETFSVSSAEVAAMTGIYHFAFAAGQIPVGVALDRFSVKNVFLVLMGTIVAGAILTTAAQDEWSFLLGQAVLGLGCSGMLLCPLTFAARNLDSANFAIWSAFILAIGNSGMLLSASPMALVIDAWGWRVGFLIPAVLGLGIMAMASFWLGRDRRPGTSGSVWSEFSQVLSIGASVELRGVIILAFVSFAAMIGIRGVWAGPWLMDIKGLGRIDAGNVILALTMMLIAAPMLISLVERRIGRTGMLLVVGHLVAAIALLMLPLGIDWPILYDLALLMAFGIAISVQPLLFSLGRQSVERAHTGKALAAVNLAFFAGAAVLQVLSAPVASSAGTAGVLVFLSLVLVTGSAAFWFTSRGRARMHDREQP